MQADFKEEYLTVVKLEFSLNSTHYPIMYSTCLVLSRIPLLSYDEHMSTYAMCSLSQATRKAVSTLYRTFSLCSIALKLLYYLNSMLRRVFKTLKLSKYTFTSMQADFKEEYLTVVKLEFSLNSTYYPIMYSTCLVLSRISSLVCILISREKAILVTQSIDRIA